MNSRDLLRITSRTFAIGIERLPRILCDATTIAYLLLRVSDYLEDNEEMEAGEKVILLNLWINILREEKTIEALTSQLTNADTNNPDAIVAQHSKEILLHLHSLPYAVQEIIIHHVINSTQGMARWTKLGPNVNDEKDLDDYMFEVAGRVGYLITQLFAWYSITIRRKENEIMPLAREFGLGLQTVNVIRGIREDFDRGWVYIPKKFIMDMGLTKEQLFDPEHREQALKVLDMMTDKAERHLRQALQYVKSLPWWQHGIRLGCIFPLMFAIRTLAVCRHNAQVFESEAKMSRTEVKKIVLDATLWGWSNLWLDRYYQELNVIGE
ncbi:MAG: squalene/phytoene synthase family protein [Anaerolineales bacterium]|uniref:squalene/phytoene synthase family protein n=1 Tax=Candidatus Villigracilis proximus TaxID=3140683 RepID=UPI003134F434|nr:squalene/phytoene synthase family protein [Anaerolineales bacterium]